jgi:cytochrome c
LPIRIALIAIKNTAVPKDLLFRTLPKRYPAKQIYIDHLERKIISGGTGAWGYPVMTPHPEIKKEDAKAMAT